MKKIPTNRFVNLTNTEKTLTSGGECLCFCGPFKISFGEDNIAYYDSWEEPTVTNSAETCYSTCRFTRGSCNNLDHTYIRSPDMLSPLSNEACAKLLKPSFPVSINSPVESFINYQ
jgi:hypothetical protein